jgi:hypothetical protein
MLKKYVPSARWIDTPKTLSSRRDTVGEFPKQRTYAFYPIEFKELTQPRLNSPTVSAVPKG